MSSKTEAKELILVKKGMTTDYNSVQWQVLLCKISFQFA